MKLSSPLPQPLPKECTKAAKIFTSFVDRGNNGLDGIIPRHVLENAKGFAIFTIVKAGFLFSARAGSGIVIAKLPDGTWSCPSAIGSAGLGFGGQAGAEMTDFLVVLNSRSAVKSFMSAGSLTLGGNMSIALGPLGRNGEAVGSLNSSGKVAAMYSYSKTRGLFGGISIEGSVIVERQDANALAYGSDVTAKQLLSGNISHPDWVMPLIGTLEACVGMPGGRKWVNDAPDADSGYGTDGMRDGGYAFGPSSGVSSPGSEYGPSPSRKKKGSISSPFPPPHWGKNKDEGSYFHQFEDDTVNNSPAVGQLIDDGSATRGFATRFESDFDASGSSRPGLRPSLSLRSKNPNTLTYDPGSPFNDVPPFPSSSADGGFKHNRSVSNPPSYLSSTQRQNSYNSFARSNGIQEDDPFSSSNTRLEDGGDYGSYRSSSRGTGDKPFITPKPGLKSPLDGLGRAIALFDFNAVEGGDLSFKKGQVITITQKSNKTDDWWTGKLDGREGIFPANFVEVV